MNHMSMNGVPVNLVLRPKEVNLSISGIRLETETQDVVNPLSMFFLDIGDGLLPVCIIAELVWEQKEDNEVVCAHRFIQIQKVDQQRLNRFVQDTQRQQGLDTQDFKISANLIDRLPLNST